MRLILLLLAIGLALAAYVPFVAKFQPQPLEYEVTKPVWETRAREYQVLIPYVTAKPGNPEIKYRTLTRTVAVKSVKFVPENRIQAVKDDQKLQFYFLAGLGAFFLVYAVVLLVAFIGILFFDHPADRHANNVNVQLAVIVAFASGIAASYFGIILHPSSNTDLQNLKNEMSMLRDVVEGATFYGNSPPPTDIYQPTDPSMIEPAPAPAVPMPLPPAPALGPPGAPTLRDETGI